MYRNSLRIVVNQWLLVFYSCVLLTTPVIAHEFWIEPAEYRFSPPATVKAHLRNGERFEGSSQPYVKRSTVRMDRVAGNEVRPVEARLGDNPAFSVDIEQAGLHVLVYERSVQTIRYAQWEKFRRFAKHKAFKDALEKHRARGLPETGFKEAYRRFAKSLVAAGNAVGRDRPVGLEAELVAQQNPYVDDLTNGLLVRALYQGQPRADTQIELFEKSPDGVVDVTLHRTDQEGYVVLPVKSLHRYLVDMVILREPADKLAARHKVVWETLWASLTFAVR